MEVYLIKYALEKGVQKIEVEKGKSCDIYYQKITSYSSIGYLRDDFCLTLKEAADIVREIIDIEINRLSCIRPFNGVGEDC